MNKITSTIVLRIEQHNIIKKGLSTAIVAAPTGTNGSFSNMLVVSWASDITDTAFLGYSLIGRLNPV
jgi:hypothetical protein